MRTIPGESPGTLARRVRADMLQARTALSRARLLHGEGSPEHLSAEERWGHRHAIRDALAARRGVDGEGIELSAQVPALELLAAARAVRAAVAAADPEAEFLDATAFLDTPAAPSAAGGPPDWNPEPPSWAESEGPAA